VDSGIKDELVLGDPTAPRFVLWGGRLRPVPAGLIDLPFFDLLSIFGKIRAGLGALGFRPAAPVSTVSEVVLRWWCFL
jgi:oxygen-dependent protoporphyrinogen oxidase